jgi:predicted nucleotidyltransferase
MQNAKFYGALKSLSDAGIDFILVGGLAAIIQGAPVVTRDVDVVFSRAPENLARILRWLEQSDAIFRNQPDRKLRPNHSHVAAGKHLNLLTVYGPVDLLGTAGEGLGYEELVPNSSEIEIDDSLRIRVLNLDTIISIKEKIASEKDLAVLPTLRSTLKELREHQR